MVTIKEQSYVFCDAFVGNDYGILFMSVWGRTSSVQQFIARMELPYHEGGIETLNFNAHDIFDGSCAFSIPNTKNLTKISGRVPGTIYGADLSQMFVYDKLATRLDHSNHKAVVLENNNVISDAQLWTLVKELSSIPLLDHWQKKVLSICYEDGYVDHISGYGINAVSVNLEVDDFEKSISAMIKNQTLTIN